MPDNDRRLWLKKSPTGTLGNGGKSRIGFEGN